MMAVLDVVGLTEILCQRIRTGSRHIQLLASLLHPAPSAWNGDRRGRNSTAAEEKWGTIQHLRFYAGQLNGTWSAMPLRCGWLHRGEPAHQFSF